MRNLVIDIRPLLPKNPPTGVPEYTRELLRAMLPLAVKRSDLRIFLFSSGKERPDDALWKGYSPVKHYHLDVSNKLLNIVVKITGKPSIDTLIRKKWDIPQDESFTVFAPNINLLPLSPRARLIITFHDLSFERYPFFLRRKESAWHRLVNPHALAKRAWHIIAVSHSTAQDLVSQYGIPLQRISVVYSGIAHGFGPKNNKTRRVLYLGSSEGRKNVGALTHAFATLAKQLPEEHLQLVMAGPPHRTVSFQERIRLYQQAYAFAYPSFFEGFGLPPAEALRSGVPVVTSHTSSLPEAVGNAALMINPHRPWELAKALQALFEDALLRERMIRCGVTQARKFSWQEAAQKTLSILLS